MSHELFTEGGGAGAGWRDVHTCLSKFTTLVIVMLKMLSALEVIVSRISSGREVLGEGGGSVMLMMPKEMQSLVGACEIWGWVEPDD